MVVPLRSFTEEETRKFFKVARVCQAAMEMVANANLGIVVDMVHGIHNPCGGIRVDGLDVTVSRTRIGYDGPPTPEERAAFDAVKLFMKKVDTKNFMSSVKDYTLRYSGLSSREIDDIITDFTFNPVKGDRMTEFFGGY